MEILEVSLMLFSAVSVLYLLSAFLGKLPRIISTSTTEDPAARLAESIQELEFDFSAGKLSPADYDRIRTLTLSEWAARQKIRNLREPGPKSSGPGLASILFAVFATGVVFSAIPAMAAEPTIRQNHLFFQFGHDNDRAVCGIQEIVVILTEEPTDQPLRLSLPREALQISPMPVPPVMPGAEASEPLREDEIEVTPGVLTVKRKLKPGKTTISFGYILPVSPEDSVRLEKTVSLRTHLLAAFAPKVKRLTSASLEIEAAEDGYRILGRDLKPGQTVDLLFEGVHQTIQSSAGPSPRSSSAPDAFPPAAQTLPSAHSLPVYFFPSVAGALLALLAFCYVYQLKKSKSLAADHHRWLMDEIESLDDASEKKWIDKDFYKQRKKILMDRLRSLRPLD